MWAVRFSKIHKGLLRRRWIQTEETAGAALDGGDEDEEKVREVLDNEGLKAVEAVDIAINGDKVVFVTGDF